MKDRKKETLAAALLLAFVMFLVVIVYRGFRYYIWYKPLYALFPDNLYLPLYLNVAENIILGAAILLAAVFMLGQYRTKKDSSKWNIIGGFMFGIMAIALLFFSSRNAYKDMLFAGSEKYLTAECNISSIRVRKSRAYRYYEIQPAEQIAGKRLYIQLNYYQYRELLKLQRENGDKMLTVYYLPNTGRMLKYE